MTDLQRRVLSALQRGVRLGQSRRLHYLRWCSCKPGKLYLAHLMRKIDCADVHLFGDVFGDHIDHKLAGTPNVACRVLGNKLLIWPVRNTNAYDGRVGTQIVISAERCCIQPPILIQAGDQCDRSRRHQAYKQLVGLVGWINFEIKIHRSNFS